MENKSWIEIGKQIGVIHSFARKVGSQHDLLTISTNELDILTLIYLSDQLLTPLELSRKLGLKKESISRTLKQLVKKKMVEKQMNNEDERSYYLVLTVVGEEVLDQNYVYLLKPYYYLIEKMGSDFDDLIYQLERADSLLAQFNYKEEME